MKDVHAKRLMRIVIGFPPLLPSEVEYGSYVVTSRLLDRATSWIIDDSVLFVLRVRLMMPHFALVSLRSFRYIRFSIVLFLNFIKQTPFLIVLHHRHPHWSWRPARSMKLQPSSIPNFITWSIGSAVVRANVLGNPPTMSPMPKIFLLIPTESIWTNLVRNQRRLVPLVVLKGRECHDMTRLEPMTLCYIGRARDHYTIYFIT